MFDDLISKRLVSRKTTPDGLSVLKYSRRAFYQNLWRQHPDLADCRGLVLDEHNNVIQMPFKKCFNFLENGIKVDRDRQVIAVRKINGFLGVCSWHNDKLLVSTTGSLTSAYVELARKYLDKPSIRALCRNNPNTSFMFEIVDESDPHIVPEEPGAYLIGGREKRLNSQLLTEEALDTLVDLNDDLAVDVRRPEITIATFDKIRQLANTVQHEGFMIRGTEPDEPVLCKLKSRFYLSKKTLMRLGQKGVELLWAKPEQFKERLDEEFYAVADYIRATYTAEQWGALKDVERRPIIERYFAQQEQQ